MTYDELKAGDVFRFRESLSDTFVYGIKLDPKYHPNKFLHWPDCRIGHLWDNSKVELDGELEVLPYCDIERAVEPTVTVS